MENIEIWKSIKGFEGLYEISNQGRIKSLPKTVTGGRYNCPRRFGEKILKPDGTRYLMIPLSKNGIKYPLLVHRLVCFAFHPNPENKPQVNHKDGDKKNNNDWNVEWATNSENQLHAFKNNLQVRRNFTDKERLDMSILRRGENSPTAKVNSEIVLAIRESKLTQLELSKIYNISRSAVGLIKSNKRWSHIK